MRLIDADFVKHTYSQDFFDGCTAWDCKNDFEISIEKIKQVSEEYGISISDITALIDFERRGGSR